MDRPIIPCSISPETQKAISDYAEALVRQAPSIGDHGLSEKAFRESGLLRGAIERLRGQQAATTKEKKEFAETILNQLLADGKIKRWRDESSGERNDYIIDMPNGRISAIELKGCLDGNNTTIYERPPQADEFVIWSLCQNAGANPRHNAWSGIHTRLSSEMIHRREKVDGLVIWDMLCGTIGRTCPKLVKNPKRATPISRGRSVPPPCIYLFPRTIPDPRNNPNPDCWNIKDVKILHTLWKAFKGNESDIVKVRIETRMHESEIQRMTRYFRKDQEFIASRWTTVKRAKR